MNRWHASLRVRLKDFMLDIELSDSPNSTTSVLALIGPNGSGKTTCLRVLTGAQLADEAEITVAERVLTSTRRNIHVPIEMRRIGYVPQGYGLFPHLSVLDNVAFGLSTGSRKLPRRDRHRKARQILDELGRGYLANRPIHGLSGGEQQFVALARAMVLDPEFLLLDEPMAALDASSRRLVRSFLAERLASYGRPTIIVTHDIRDVIALNAEVAVLENGKVVQRATLDTLRNTPGSDFVAEFVGADLFPKD